MGTEQPDNTKAGDQGDEVCFCSAYYNLTVFDRAVGILQKREEFQEVGGSLLWTKGKPPHKQFKWLRRGPSGSVRLALESPVAGVPFEVSWLERSDSKPIAVLADITIDLTSLTVSTLSRRRLEAAKQLLRECLGNLIIPRREECISQEEMEKMHADKLAPFRGKVSLTEKDIPPVPGMRSERDSEKTQKPNDAIDST